MSQGQANDTIPSEAFLASPNPDPVTLGKTSIDHMAIGFFI